MANRVLTIVLSKQPGVSVVGVATDASVAAAHVAQSDVFLIHDHLPDHAVHVLTREISRAKRRPRVVVMAVPSDPERIVRYIELGAVGYVVSGEPIDRLYDVIGLVNDGGARLDPPVFAALLRRYSELRRIADRAHVSGG
jgi:DNA-binding NarL/FixJ family response regulator